MNQMAVMERVNGIASKKYRQTISQWNVVAWRPGGQTPSQQKKPIQSSIMMDPRTIPSNMTGNIRSRITVLRLLRQIWVWMPTYFMRED